MGETRNPFVNLFKEKSIVKRANLVHTEAITKNINAAGY